jgi:uncharacterized glyoxalase superfamily protein PhnB
MRTIFFAWLVSGALGAVVGCQVNPPFSRSEKSTMLTKLTPNMMVTDVGRTVAYYRDILGFAFVMGVPPDSQEVVTQFDGPRPLAFAIMQQGSVQIMFQSQQSLVEELPQVRDKPVGATATFYIELADARQLYQRLRNQVEIVSALHRTFYGKEEFGIQDCNGYFLWFAGTPAETTQ